MARLKTAYRKIIKRTMPSSWFDKLTHTHNALGDAVERDMLISNILADNLGNVSTRTRYCDGCRESVVRTPHPIINPIRNANRVVQPSISDLLTASE